MTTPQNQERLLEYLEELAKQYTEGLITIDEWYNKLVLVVSDSLAGRFPS